MKTRLLVASTLVLGMVAQSAQAFEPGTSVVNSKHNLSSSRGQSDGDIFVLANQGTGGPGSGNFESDTTQICVFCHTPHGANNNIAVPLWNKTNSQSSYNSYSMKGRDSLGTANSAGMSLACLTCHDGTQAMDAFMNAPGLHVNTTDQTGKSAGFNWNNGGSAGTATSGGADVIGGILNAGRRTTQTETGPVLGTDMSNDHPIGMQYCGSQTGGNCQGNNSSAFIAPASLDSRIKIFGVGVNGTNSTKVGQGKDGANDGTVECASCHNPHGTGNQAFLRVPRTGSAICLACHVK